MKIICRAGFIVIGLLLWAWLVPTTAHAAGVVGNGTPASCTGNTLGNRIGGGGLVTFNCGPNPRTITVNTYVIDEDTTIDGGGRITLDANLERQIFLVQNGATLTLRNINLSRGNWSAGGCISVPSGGAAVINNVEFRQCMAEQGNGGAISSSGTVTIVASRFISNTATGTGSLTRGRGGAIYNTGTLSASFSRFIGNQADVHGGALFSFRNATIYDSEFANNRAEGGGGAIAVLRPVGSSDKVIVERSLFVANQANTTGGAILNVGGEVVIRNSTLSGNRAGSGGGGLYADGMTVSTLEFSTVNANRADLGGGIFVFTGATVNLRASIVANSLDGAGNSPILNCDNAGTLNTQGHNIVGDNSCFNPGLGSDRPNTNPQLGDLLDNGGFTRTHMPDPGSPALDKVPNAQCPGNDQRAALRLAANCDSGAAERGGAFTTVYIPMLSRD